MNNYEQEIINYYLAPNSERDTVAHFNLKNRHVLNKILIANKIEKHAKETIKYLNVRNTARGCLIKNNKLVCPYNPKLNDRFEAKLTCLQKNDVEIWPYERVKFAIDYAKNKYGKKYLQQFRTKKPAENAEEPEKEENK